MHCGASHTQRPSGSYFEVPGRRSSICGVEVIPSFPKVRGITKCVWSQICFSRPGVPRPRNAHFQESTSCLALPPKAARPTNHSVPAHVSLFGRGTLGLHKTSWPKNHFGIPLTSQKPTGHTHLFPVAFWEGKGWPRATESTTSGHGASNKKDHYVGGGSFLGRGYMSGITDLTRYLRGLSWVSK